MSILVIQLPPRERLSAQRADTALGQRLPAEWDFHLSADGRTLASSGRAALALLPKAGRVVLMLADADVSWHRITVPKAPTARLRAALAGVMEEVLLDDSEAVHLALGPGAVQGHTGWVAVVNRSWLASALAALEGAGLTIETVLPAAAPRADAPGPAAPAALAVKDASLGGVAHGHFMHNVPQREGQLTLVLCNAAGVQSVGLDGTLARSLIPGPEVSVRWTATPAAAAAAEAWLGKPVALLAEGERALEALSAGANLRQFDLALRNRGSLALRDAARRFLSRDWRLVRWGLAAMVGVQLLGLNVWAWQQRQAVETRKLAMTTLLRSTHPGVRAVLDAPVQMLRETERLRAAAGRAGDADFEALLAASAMAWPDNQGPAQSLRFEAARLTLTAAGWAEPQLTQFKSRLAGAGYGAELAEGRVTVSRAAARGAL